MLGSMGELGTDSAAEHEKLVRRLSGTDYQIYLVGEPFRDALHSLGMTEADSSLHGLSVQSFPDSAALAEHIKNHPLTGAAILLKGSRSQRMEVVLPEL